VSVAPDPLVGQIEEASGHPGGRIIDLPGVRDAIAGSEGDLNDRQWRVLNDPSMVPPGTSDRFRSRLASGIIAAVGSNRATKQDRLIGPPAPEPPMPNETPVQQTIRAVSAAAMGAANVLPKEVKQIPAVAERMRQGRAALGPLQPGEGTAEAAGGILGFAAEAGPLATGAEAALAPLAARFLPAGAAAIAARAAAQGVAFGGVTGAASGGTAAERITRGAASGAVAAVATPLSEAAGGLAARGATAAARPAVEAATNKAVGAIRETEQSVADLEAQGLSHAEAVRIAAPKAAAAAREAQNAARTTTFATRAVGASRGAAASAATGATFGGVAPIAEHFALKATGQPTEFPKAEDVLRSSGQLALLGFLTGGGARELLPGERPGDISFTPGTFEGQPRLPGGPSAPTEPMAGPARQLPEFGERVAEQASGGASTDRTPLTFAGGRPTADVFRERLDRELPQKPDEELTQQDVAEAAQRAGAQITGMRSLQQAMEPPPIKPQLSGQAEVQRQNRMQSMAREMSAKLDQAIVGKTVELNLPGIGRQPVDVMKTAYFPWDQSQQVRVIVRDHATGQVVPVYFADVADFRRSVAYVNPQGGQGGGGALAGRVVGGTAALPSTASGGAPAAPEEAAPAPQPTPPPGHPEVGGVVRTSKGEATILSVDRKGSNPARWTYTLRGPSGEEIRQPGRAVTAMPQVRTAAEEHERRLGLVRGAAREMRAEPATRHTPELERLRQHREELASQRVTGGNQVSTSVQGAVSSTVSSQLPSAGVKEGALGSPPPKNAAGVRQPTPSGETARETRPRAQAGGPTGEVTREGAPSTPPSRPTTGPSASAAPPAAIRPGATPTAGGGRPGTVGGVGSAAGSGEGAGVRGPEAAHAQAARQPVEGHAGPRAGRLTRDGVRAVSDNLRPRVAEKNATTPTVVNDVHASWNKAFDAIKTPEDKRIQLMEHQEENAARALQAWDQGNHAALVIGDTTGIGKTVSALTAAFRARHELGAKNIVLVAPNDDILRQWHEQALTFGFDLNRVSTNQRPTPKDGVIHATTYATLRARGGVMTKDAPDLAIFDESHNLKNFRPDKALPTADAGVRLAKTATRNLFLSATPMESALHFAYVAPFVQAYNGSFDRMLGTLGIWYDEAKKRWNGLSPEKLKQIHDALVQSGNYVRNELDLATLRRRDGTPVQLHMVPAWSGISEHWAQQYNTAARTITEFMRSLRSPVEARVVAAQRTAILRAILEQARLADAVKIGEQMRAKGMSVAYFVERLTGGDYGEKESDSPVVTELWSRLADAGVTHGSPVDALEKHYTQAGVPFASITGRAAAGGAVRSAAIDGFQSGRLKVAIVTVAAGGTGLNLQNKTGLNPRAAVMVTTPYTAIQMTQALGRFHRLGSQTSSIAVVLATNSPTDERYVGRVLRRVAEMGAIVRGGSASAGEEPIDTIDYEFDQPDVADRVAASSSDPAWTKNADEALKDPGFAPMRAEEAPAAPAARPTEPAAEPAPEEQEPEPSAEPAEALPAETPFQLESQDARPEIKPIAMVSWMEAFDDAVRDGQSLEDAKEMAGDKSASEPPENVDLEERYGTLRRTAQEALGQTDLFGGAPMLGAEGEVARGPVGAAVPEGTPIAGAAEVAAARPPEPGTMRAQSIHVRGEFQQREGANEHMVVPENIQSLLEKQGGFSRDELVKNPVIVWTDPADDRVYVVNGHHRLYLAQHTWEKIDGEWKATGTSDRDIPVVQVFGTYEDALRQAEFANKAGISNTTTDEAGIAYRRLAAGEPVERVAAGLSRSVAATRQLNDFFHVDRGLREQYFPNGAEDANLGSWKYGAILGSVARRYPKLFTAPVQRQLLQTASEHKLDQSSFAEWVRRQADLLGAMPQTELAGAESRPAPEDFNSSLLRVQQMVRSQKKLISGATKTLGDLEKGATVPGLEPAQLSKTVALLREELARMTRLDADAMSRAQSIMQSYQTGGDWQTEMRGLRKYIEKQLGPVTPVDIGANTLSFMGTGALARFFASLIIRGTERAHQRWVRETPARERTVHMKDPSGRTVGAKPIVFNPDPQRSLYSYKVARAGRMGGQWANTPRLNRAAHVTRAELIRWQGDLSRSLHLALGEKTLQWLGHPYSSSNFTFWSAADGDEAAKAKLPEFAKAALANFRAWSDNVWAAMDKVSKEAGRKRPGRFSEYMPHVLTNYGGGRLADFAKWLFPDARTDTGELQDNVNRFLDTREGGNQIERHFMPAIDTYIRAAARYLSVTPFMDIARAELTEMQTRAHHGWVDQWQSARDQIRAAFFADRDWTEKMLDSGLRAALFNKHAEGVMPISQYQAALWTKMSLQDVQALEHAGKPVRNFVLVAKGHPVAFTTSKPWIKVGTLPSGATIYAGKSGAGYMPGVPVRRAAIERMHRARENAIRFFTRGMKPIDSKDVERALEREAELRAFYRSPTRRLMGWLAHRNLTAMIGYSLSSGNKIMAQSLITAMPEWGLTSYVYGAMRGAKAGVNIVRRAMIRTLEDRGYMTKQQADAANAAIPLMLEEILPAAAGIIPGEVSSLRKTAEMRGRGMSKVDTMARQLLGPLGVLLTTEAASRGIDMAVALVAAQRLGLDNGRARQIYEATEQGRRQALNDILADLDDQSSAINFATYVQGLTQYHYDWLGYGIWRAYPVWRLLTQFTHFPISFALHQEARPLEGLVRGSVAFARGMGGGGAGEGGGGAPPPESGGPGTPPPGREPPPKDWFHRKQAQGGADWFTRHAFDLFWRQALFFGALLAATEWSRAAGHPLNFLAWGVPLWFALGLYGLHRAFPDNEAFDRWWNDSKFGIVNPWIGLLGTAIPGMGLMRTGFGAFSFLYSEGARAGPFELLRRLLVPNLQVIRRMLQENPEFFIDNPAVNARWLYRVLDVRTALWGLSPEERRLHHLGMLNEETRKAHTRDVFPRMRVPGSRNTGSSVFGRYAVGGT
jgi:superfamily II DNA or RNA helicase